MTDILKGAEFAAELEKQRQRHKRIDERRVRGNARLEESKRQHAELAKEIKTLFGTDKPEELATLIANKEIENHEKLVDYTQRLDALDLQVKALEDALGMDITSSRSAATGSTL